MGTSRSSLTVVLSPHPDDAVLDAFSVLVAPEEVLVVNVFDGDPPPGPPSYSVRLCGASDGQAQMRRRRDEDRRALATVGRRGVSLGFLDADGRPADPTVEEIAAAVTEAVPELTALVAPVGIGSHPDHQLVRDAALRIASETGAALEFCADLPYAIAWGWPAWVTGDRPDPNLDPNVQWRKALDRLPGEPGGPIVERLSDGRLDAKERALAEYVSQLSMLGGGPHRRLARWALRYEVRWPFAAR